jgi:hypothetical protein
LVGALLVPGTAYAATPASSTAVDAQVSASVIAAVQPNVDWQTRANQAVEVLRTKFPAEFTDVLLGDASFTVRFRAEVPPEAAGLLRGVGVPVELMGGAGFSEAELIVAIGEVHSDALALVGAGVDFSTEPVAGTNEIKVILDPEPEVATPADVPVPDVEVVEQVLDGPAAGSPAPEFAVSVSLDEDAAVQTEGYGQAGGNEVSGCTSAFVVKKKNSAELGVLTAGHCPNRLQQISANGNFWFDFRAEHRGVNGDMQWMRSPVMMDSWFHYDYGLGLPVRAVATAGVGTAVCHFGMTTGRSCGKVTAVNVSVSADGIIQGGMTRVAGAGLVSAGGDSGGPWYQGTTAYGIHHGSAGDGSRFFTPVTKAEAQFGVTVCIEGRCG